MNLKVYLPIAFLVFLAATAGGDSFALTSIGNQSLAAALQEHFYWAGVQFIGTLLLLAPFVAVAFVCAQAEKDARSRTVLLIFAGAMLTLSYFYFEGYQGAEYALLEKKWTAATLSVGLLPFFIGVPVILVSWGATALAKKYNRRISDGV